jgi:hypothetical protein
MRVLVPVGLGTARRVPDSEAFDYDRCRHPIGRPIQSHEAPAAWAVCVDPV